MFYQNDVVKVLIPNAVNTGYDYRLNAMADVGQFVRVSVMNRPYVGIIISAGDSGLPPEKIKPVQKIYNQHISPNDLKWIFKMSEWTMMPAGAVLKLILNVPEAFDEPKTEPLYAFNINEKIRITDARQSVADAFSSNDNDPMTASDIQNIARVSPAVVRTLIKTRILLPVAEQAIHIKQTIINYFDTKSVTLNDEQKIAADAIKLDGFSVSLLDGITGSGKTQVYFDSVINAYESGKNILIMMPEIALTAQFIKRFTDRFGAPPVLWHSALTTARRRDIWRGVSNGEIRIVIGTRSALFLPWQNLGLIIVDEEHDGSYKQEDMGNYNARDMAILRASISNFPIILASATPSFETIKNVFDGKYKQIKLHSRYAGASLPKIETVDLRIKENKLQTSEPGNISVPLQNAIQETLDSNQQVMLFINRRGFAPIVQCKSCGWVAQCPDCSAGMTLHKKTNRLLCHICGHFENVPNKCPKCGGTEITNRGSGIEKIAEEVKQKFPNANIELVSSDTIMSRQALQRLVDQMESGEINIVIGTQILAKGHHFPNLTLVGVIDADMGLFGTDFRSAEKTFAQLFQVAGRAGRGEIPGRVMLQTYQPEHKVLQAIIDGNRDEFMAIDMDGRKSAKMPPYGQLIALIVESQKENVLQEYCKKLAEAAPKIMDNNSKILGPIPAQIYQIRNWYRMRFLVSGDEKTSLQPIVSHWLAKVKQPSNVRVKIDVSPQSFM